MSGSHAHTYKMKQKKEDVKHTTEERSDWAPDMPPSDKNHRANGTSSVFWLKIVAGNQSMTESETVIWVKPQLVLLMPVQDSFNSLKTHTGQASTHYWRYWVLITEIIIILDEFTRTLGHCCPACHAWIVNNQSLLHTCLIDCNTADGVWMSNIIMYRLLNAQVFTIRCTNNPTGISS